jgi:hypothetical protein
MKRLTKRIDGEVQQNHDHDTPANEWDDTPINKLFRNNIEHCMERLAAYEDTGLMPDEVSALKVRLGERVDEVARLKQQELAFVRAIRFSEIYGRDYADRVYDLARFGLTIDRDEQDSYYDDANRQEFTVDDFIAVAEQEVGNEHNH